MVFVPIHWNAFVCLRLLVLLQLLLAKADLSCKLRYVVGSIFLVDRSHSHISKPNETTTTNICNIYKYIKCVFVRASACVHEECNVQKSFWLRIRW